MNIVGPRRQHRCTSRGRPLAFALLTTVFWASAPQAGAEVVKLHVGQPLPRFSLLHPGVHRYVRYKIAASGDRTAIDVWERQIDFAVGPDRRPGMHIVQRWDEVDPKVILIQDSWFDRGTFAPLTHIRHRDQDGKIQIRGFRFSGSSVTGIADLPENNDRDFAIPLSEPTYNFEYDMELIQALPLAPGRTFDIPFYDAGIDKKPDRYRFSVEGSSRITGWDGRSIDCWLVTADYNSGKVVSRLWFAKRGQLLVREEQVLPDGTLLVKTLLPPEAIDSKIVT